MINIQDEAMKIHSKFGITEKANYEIQLLTERYAKEYHETELKKLRVTDVSGSVCEFGCEKCGMTFSGAQQMLLHSRICPQNEH